MISEGSEKKTPESHLICLLDIIAIVIKSCITDGIKRLGRLSPASMVWRMNPKEQPPDLPLTVMEWIREESIFIDLIVPMIKFTDSPGIIVEHISWGNKETSCFFME